MMPYLKLAQEPCSQEQTWPPKSQLLLKQGGEPCAEGLLQLCVGQHLDDVAVDAECCSHPCG
jgi:hypothetical protein